MLDWPPSGLWNCIMKSKAVYRRFKKNLPWMPLNLRARAFRDKAVTVGARRLARCWFLTSLEFDSDLDVICLLKLLNKANLRPSFQTNRWCSFEFWTCWIKCCSLWSVKSRNCNLEWGIPGNLKRHFWFSTTFLKENQGFGGKSKNALEHRKN